MKFGENDIVIPLKVLEEIDKHKKRQDGVGSNARHIIRTLDLLRSRGNLHHGVQLSATTGIISAKTYDRTDLPEGFEVDNPDNEIIGTALTERRNNPDREVVVVSNDINMRVKCDAIGLACEGYDLAQVVKDVVQIYSGFSTEVVSEALVDDFYSGKQTYLSRVGRDNIFPNQYILLQSEANSKKTALAKYRNDATPLKKIISSQNFSKQGVWGVKPRNKEQTYAMDLLLDPSVSIVTLIGRAGSGKTLLSLACGLSQVLENTEGSGASYRNLIVSRPIQPLGKDIGYLPGSLEEKMLPWIAPIQDNLRFLMGNDRNALRMYIDDGTIEIEALTYIRGRSISNAFIIIDEAQNLTMHELKTIITRVGDNTKIVLCGDIEQIDNVYIDATSNGLTYAVEKFKPYDLSGHVTLSKGERSPVATLAAEVL
tara:strand:+ start:242 stop:1522 length:1281 start_codon:yes stop_codon:yes gene_type:complete